MRLLVIALLLTTACSKDDPPAAAARSAESNPEVAALEAKSIEILDKIADIFTKAGADCDKLAVNLEHYVVENKQAFVQIKELARKQTAAQRADFTARTKDQTMQLVTRMAVSMQACGKSPAVMAALKKIRP
jgi:hypothetical protein